MINRTHRFHGHGSLRYVYQRGELVRAGKLSLKYVLNERRQEYRLAVVVSKKVSKSAVLRNRIRRRIYEIVRHLQADITAPYDLVITVFSEDVRDMPNAELTRLITSQLEKAGVLPRASKSDHGKIEAKGEK